MFPESPVYTSIYAPEVMPVAYATWDVHTQYLPMVTRKHQFYLPLYPLAFESMQVIGCDLVISNTSAFAHGIRTGSGMQHLCYC
jgi:hypothetical protein